MITTYVQFRDLHLAAFNSREPNGGWPARPVYHDLAGDGARRALGTERSPRDKRTEKRRWMLVSPSRSELDYAYGDLLNEIGQYGRLVGLTESGLALWTDAELTDARAVSDPRPVTGRMRGVGIDVETEFILPTPWWFAEQPVTLTFTDIYDADDSDLLLMGVMGATPGSAVPMTWNIRGRANTGRIVITLISGAGTVTKFAMSNTTTNYSLQWDGTLTTGQELVIDTDASSIYRNSVAAYEQLTLGAHTRWMELAPGINDVTVEIDDTATDDSTVLQVAYYPAYP